MCRFNVVYQQCFSHVHMQRRGIVLLIWENRDMHYIYRKELTLAHITYAVSFEGVATKPPVRLSMFTFKADIFHTRIQKP